MLLALKSSTDVNRASLRRIKHRYHYVKPYIRRQESPKFQKVENRFWVLGSEIHRGYENGVTGQQVSEYPTPVGSRGWGRLNRGTPLILFTGNDSEEISGDAVEWIEPVFGSAGTGPQ